MTGVNHNGYRLGPMGITFRARREKAVVGWARRVPRLAKSGRKPRTAEPGDLRAVPEKRRKLIPEYVKDYVSLNPFLA